VLVGSSGDPVSFNTTVGMGGGSWVPYLKIKNKSANSAFVQFGTFTKQSCYVACQRLARAMANS